MATRIGVGVRRRAQTRAALIAAAQGLLAEGRTEVPVLEIALRAGVGVGSFYNHFTTKDELFAAAVDAAAEHYGAVLHGLSGGESDAAVIVAQSFRLAGRLHRREPRLSKSLIRRAPDYLARGGPLVDQVQHNIGIGLSCGRFEVGHLELATGAVFGALIMLGNWLHQHPQADADVAVDLLAVDVLKMLGIDAAEAARIVAGPLPELPLIGTGVVDM